MKRYIVRVAETGIVLGSYATERGAKRAAQQYADLMKVELQVCWCDDTGKPRTQVAHIQPS